MIDKDLAFNIPGFTIEKEVGHGGMATVYLGVQDLLKRDVALKVMLPEMVVDKNFRKSFLSEGAIIASLDHPNIVRIHDIGIVDETILYMAMEYLSGNTLKEKLSKGVLSFPDAFRILKQVASGLTYAHDKGYIHRDIKPGNILFRADGTAVITDFGIAKLQDTSGELTRMGYTMGTVQYMSPEQVVTTDLDKRSDIYSLGLIFYEMLTGLKAFKAETAIQAIHQHTTLPPPTLEGEYAYLQTALDKVLAKEPENRYQNAVDFVTAISEAESLDKTVIHQIQDDSDKTQIFIPGQVQQSSAKSQQPDIENNNEKPIEDNSDKTQIFIPEQAQETKAPAQLQTAVEKKKGNLIPIALGGSVLAGLVAFGVFKLMGTDEPITNKPVAEVVTNTTKKVESKPDLVKEKTEVITEKKIEDPVKKVIATVIETPEIDPVSKPEVLVNTKPITKIYQPKTYHNEIEAELTELVKYSQEILEIAPDNKKARKILEEVSARYHSLALDFVKSMDAEKATLLVDKGLKISSNYEPLTQLKSSLDRKNRKISKTQLNSIKELNGQAKTHMQAGRYVLPERENALETYQKVLAIDPHNLIASKEINSLLFIFEEQVKTYLSENKYQANEFLNQALAIAPFNQKLLQLQNKIMLSQKLN